MPITILDYVKSRVGEKDTYTPEDFYGNGVEMLGGCQQCEATIAAYNAYPSTSGYWRCADCIGSSGFATVEEFISCEPFARQQARTEGQNDPDDTGIICPSCQAIENIREIRDCTFECGFCETVWSL